MMIPIRLWKYATIVLVIVLVALVYTNGNATSFAIGSLNIGVGGSSQDAVVDSAVDFINENLLLGMATASVDAVSVENNLYKLDLIITYRDGLIEEFSSYVSKDGKTLFPTAIAMDEVEEDVEDDTEDDTTDDDEVLPEIDYSTSQHKGAVNAKITLVEYTDFECPFCFKGFETIEQIVEAYGDEINLIYKNFPLSFHANAQKAAEAAECAGDQDMFWEMYETLFQNNDALAVDDLKAYADDMGLDTEQFNACLDNDEKAELVQQDLADGQSLGITGTPTFIINGKKIVGAQPFEVIEEVIKEELAKDDTVEEDTTEDDTEEVVDDTEEVGNETVDDTVEVTGNETVDDTEETGNETVDDTNETVEE